MPLYLGYNKYNKLFWLTKLYNHNGRSRWFNQSFSNLLNCLEDILLTNNVLPISIYEAKKCKTVLGMSYKKTHACPNDCILYCKSYQNLNEYPTCRELMWENQKMVETKRPKPST